MEAELTELRASLSQLQHHPKLGDDDDHSNPADGDDDHLSTGSLTKVSRAPPGPRGPGTGLPSPFPFFPFPFRNFGRAAFSHFGHHLIIMADRAALSLCAARLSSATTTVQGESKAQSSKNNNNLAGAGALPTTYWAAPVFAEASLLSSNVGGGAGALVRPAAVGADSIPSRLAKHIHELEPAVRVRLLAAVAGARATIVGAGGTHNTTDALWSEMAEQASRDDEAWVRALAKAGFANARCEEAEQVAKEVADALSRPLPSPAVDEPKLDTAAKGPKDATWPTSPKMRTLADYRADVQAGADAVAATRTKAAENAEDALAPGAPHQVLMGSTHMSRERARENEKKRSRVMMLDESDVKALGTYDRNPQADDKDKDKDKRAKTTTTTQSASADGHDD